MVMVSEEENVMDEFILTKPYAHSKPIDFSTHPRAFRVYRDAPNSVYFQVRTRTSKQARISGASLSFDEVRSLRDALARMIGEG
jgi:hypothetical protein